MEDNYLFEKYRNYFPLGAAVGYDKLESYKELLRNFNSISTENELKFERIHPQREQYEFTKSDKLVQYAIENNMLVRGHTFVWHNQNPDWLFEKSNLKRENLLSDLYHHIGTVMERYKDSVYCWDVVNEIFADDDTVFRKTPWLEYVGEDYVEKAFHFAHEANPRAELYLNEYNCEIGEKLDKVIAFVTSLKKKNVPIDGVGIQGHYSIYFPGMDMIRDMLSRFSRLNIKVQITELDVSLFRFQDERKDIKVPTTEMLDAQTRYYSDLFTIFKEYKDIIGGVTFWGVADDYTWLDDYPVEGRKNWPLLFDENLNPKPAYTEIMKG